MKTDSSDQQADIFDTPKQTKFNDSLKQIKEEQTNIDMRLLFIFLTEHLIKWNKFYTIQKVRLVIIVK